MSAVILSFPTNTAQRANGAGLAVAIAAKRMGYRPHHIARAAALARREVLDGRKSAARAVADMTRDLSKAARNHTPGAARATTRPTIRPCWPHTNPSKRRPPL